MGYAIEDLPVPIFGEPRRVSLDLRNHLRRLIIDDRLPAGEVIKQAQLARVFGVSRTPMREAFRMLQEEGLIEAETNQRARVRELNAIELDQLYSVRIMLESLGARLTSGHVTASEQAHARELLTQMDLAREVGDTDAWMRAHRLFHRLCVAGGGEPLMRVIDSYSERSERYVRLHQLRHPHSFSIAHDEHVHILDAIVLGDRDLAGSLMANHLAHTSATVLADMAADAKGLASAEALAIARAHVHTD